MANRACRAVGVVLLLAVTRGSAAVAVDVQVPTSSAIAGPGQAATVLLSIAPSAGQDGVLSGAFSLAYAGGVVTATGVMPTALLAPCTTTTTLASDRVTLLFACTQPLSSGGALFDIAFQGVAVGVSPLVFSATDAIADGCLLNEGTPSCQASGGELVVGAPPATATATATTSAAATVTPSATPVTSATGTISPTPTGGLPASGRLVQNLFRAGDGTAYQVARVLQGAGPAEAVRVTTVAGAAATVGGCSNPGGDAGSSASAAVGAPLSVPLAPFSTVRRTALLLPADVASIAFDPAAGGRLRIGTGGGAATICATAIDCVGQPNVAPLAAIDSSLGGVATSCVTSPIEAGCDGGNRRQAFAFGLPSVGAPPRCTLAPTTDTTICAPEPSDGVRLVTGQAMVFVYGGELAAVGFDTAIAGFGIDLDGANPAGCGAGQVVDATAATISQPAPPIPTATALTSPTPTPTRGRAAIPVVPAPFSGAGLLMLGGLAAAMLLALRRRAG